MWYILIVLIVGFIAVFGFTYCQNVLTDFNKRTIISKDSSKTKMSRKEMEDQLKKLSSTSVNSNLNMGAMCYDTAGPPERAEYVCPKCGEKTLYTSDTWTVKYEIDGCRINIKKIKAIQIKLDEFQFCKKCSPNITKPQLCIDVNYQGEAKLHHICDITTQDLKLILEFTEGKVIHKTSNEGEEPLNDHSNRIKELLGIK